MMPTARKGCFESIFFLKNEIQAAQVGAYY